MSADMRIITHIMLKISEPNKKNEAPMHYFKTS
jgi:hypothetical protein